MLIRWIICLKRCDRTQTSIKALRKSDPNPFVETPWIPNGHPRLFAVLLVRGKKQTFNKDGIQIQFDFYIFDW
jgi:hypothetical protein